MTQATEIIGCLINGQNVNWGDNNYNRFINAKAVFNGDNLYAGVFNWIRIAPSPIDKNTHFFETEQGVNMPNDAYTKITYQANEHGIDIDLGTESRDIYLSLQIGNNTVIKSTATLLIHYQYFNTWTSIISPCWPYVRKGWSYDNTKMGYDEENKVSVCQKSSIINDYTKIYNEHGCAVGDIIEITDREFIENDHYKRVGFGGNNDYNNGYASQAAVNHIGIPLKYQRHISYPLPPYPARGYYGAGYRITGLPNGRYQVSAFMSLDKAKPYHWNCNNAEEYLDIVGDTTFIKKVDVYRRYTYCASEIVNVSNGIIELLIASAYAGKIIPLNFVKLEKLEDE